MEQVKPLEQNEENGSAGLFVKLFVGLSSQNFVWERCRPILNNVDGGLCGAKTVYRATCRKDLKVLFELKIY